MVTGVMVIGVVVTGVMVIGGPVRGQDLPDPGVRIASEHWHQYSLPDATGLYWDLMRLVFEPVGLAVEPMIAPYPRTVAMVEAGEADLWLAAFDDETDWAIFPRFPMDGEQVVAVVPHHRIRDWTGESSLRDAKVGFLRGYSYHRYIDVPMQVTELSGRLQGLLLVQRGRLSAFLGARYQIRAAIAQTAGAFRDLRMLPVKWLPLLPGIANTPRGRYIAQIYDCQMARLFADGAVRMLHRRWQLPYRYFEAGVALRFAEKPAPGPKRCLDDLWRVYPDGPPAH